MIVEVAAALKAKGYAREGDLAVITMAVPIGEGGSSNLMKLHRIA